MGTSNGGDGKGGETPSWAAMDETEFAAFEEALALRAAQWTEEFAVDIALDLDGGVISFDGRTVSLREIARLCRGKRPDDYPSLIAGHFDAFVQALLPESDGLLAQFSENGNDFEQFRDQLKVRIYKRSTLLSSGEDSFVSRPVSQTEGDHRRRTEEPDDLVATLVVDAPEAIFTVKRAWVEQWKKTEETLFQQAARNIARTEQPVVEDFELGESVRLRSLVGDSFFTASHVLHLSRFVDPSEYGLIVAIPHRHAVLIHRIVDHHVLDAIEALLPVCVGMYEEGPGSVSDQLFWWRDGRLIRLPSRRHEGSRKVALPHSFVTKVLKNLMRDTE